MLSSRMTMYFGVSSEVIKVAVFVYVGGFCLGPILWEPLSELFGVRWNFILSTAGMTLFNMACGLAPNIGALIVLRFLAGTFASSSLAVGGGCIAHLWSKNWLGVGMAAFSSAPSIGPSLGPLVGGWISVSGATWKWIFWGCTIFSGTCCAVSFLTLPETNPNYTLKKKARRLRMETGDDRYKAPIELRVIKPRELVSRWLLLPILMLLFEPMLQAITLYMAFVYGLLYLFFDAYPVVFAEIHGMNGVQTGLAFIGLLVGNLLGCAVYIFYENPRYMRKAARLPEGIYPKPEERLMSAIYGAPVLVISLFWFAWTSKYVNVWAPICGGGFFGTAFFFIYFSLMTYLADAYREKTASALSVNTAVRSSFGVGFPLVRVCFYLLTVVCNSNVP